MYTVFMLRVIHLTKDAIKKGALTALLLLPIVSSAQIEYEIDSYLPFDNLQDLIVAILRIFVTIATPIIVLFIIYAGFKYVTAQGNAQQVQEATRALTYAIIGAVLILGAVAISEIIANTIGAFQP
jgi:heme/copper-type cytochrome/quinol oxidase subunit 2